MTPTATKSKTKSPISELAQREAAEREAKEHASKLSRDLTDRTRRLVGHFDTRGAIDELRRLHIQEPELFTDDGAPKQGTAAESCALEIASLEHDIQQLQPQAEQARRREAAATLAREEFARQNVAALIEARRPQAEAFQAEVQAKAAEYADLLRDLISLIHEQESLLGVAPAQKTVRVPGLDLAAEQMRIAERLEFPLPMPELRDV